MDDKELFLEWFKHIIVHTRKISTKRILVLFDRYSTHIKNIEPIDMAICNGIDLLLFPIHTTHKFQPLNVDFISIEIL